MGGCVSPYQNDNEFALSTVELLDQSRIKWVKRSPLPHALEECFTFYINNRVNALSGSEQRTLQYDVTRDT